MSLYEKPGCFTVEPPAQENYSNLQLVPGAPKKLPPSWVLLGLATTIFVGTVFRDPGELKNVVKQIGDHLGIPPLGGNVLVDDGFIEGPSDIVFPEP